MGSQNLAIELSKGTTVYRRHKRDCKNKNCPLWNVGCYLCCWWGLESVHSFSLWFFLTGQGRFNSLSHDYSSSHSLHSVTFNGRQTIQFFDHDEEFVNQKKIWWREYHIQESIVLLENFKWEISKKVLTILNLLTEKYPRGKHDYIFDQMQKKISIIYQNKEEHSLEIFFLHISARFRLIYFFFSSSIDFLKIHFPWRQSSYINI